MGSGAKGFLLLMGVDTEGGLACTLEWRDLVFWGLDKGRGRAMANVCCLHCTLPSFLTPPLAAVDELTAEDHLQDRLPCQTLISLASFAAGVVVVPKGTNQESAGGFGEKPPNSKVYFVPCPLCPVGCTVVRMFCLELLPLERAMRMEHQHGRHEKLHRVGEAGSDASGGTFF